MTPRRRFSGFGLLLIVSVLLIATEQVQACAVCFGDPDSRMVKGVVAGVLVLVGVISAVLAGVASVGVCWMQRSRRLDRQLAEDASGGSL